MKITVRKTRSGSWCLRISNRGKRKQVTVSGGRAVAERMKKELELKYAARSLSVNIDGPPTFRQVASKFLALVEVRRSPGTYERYEISLRKHVLPTIGKMPLSDITRGTVRDLLIGLSKRYSKSYVRLALAVISGVFQHAIDDELVSSSPAVGVLRRLDFVPKKEEIRPLTEEQARRMFDELGWHRTFFFLLYHTGLRHGEGIALEWSDIDFKSGLVHVSKTAHYQEVRRTTKGKMKRSVDMSEELRGELLNYRERNRRYCVKHGIRTDLVFHERGKLLSPNTMRYRWKMALNRTGIGDFRIHDLRHTFASLLLARGAPVSYVSQMLGHSSQHITLTRYAHFMPSETSGYVSLLNSAEKSGKGCKSVAAKAQP